MQETRGPPFFPGASRSSQKGPWLYTSDDQPVREALVSSLPSSCCNQQRRGSSKAQGSRRGRAGHRESRPSTRASEMATATIDSGLFRNPNRDLVVNIKGTKKPQDDDYAYPKQDWFWTGKPPVHGECPGVNGDGHMTSLPLPNCSEVRASVAVARWCREAPSAQCPPSPRTSAPRRDRAQSPAGLTTCGQRATVLLASRHGH